MSSWLVWLICCLFYGFVVARLCGLNSRREPMGVGMESAIAAAKEAPR